MNNPLDTRLFDEAVKFATDAHSGTERRGKNFPYIIHPMEAAAIVATVTSDPEMLAAAILHDTVEDTDATLEQIRERFGARVATLVQHETAPLPKGTPWRVRRQAQVDLLASAPYDCKVVAIGDKLSNLRAIAHDYRQIGDRLWQRFSAPNGMEDVAWYYRNLAVALADLDGTLPYQEFLSLLEATFGPENESR
ncbi:MAG: bifunctional (p)ppGpp synthetase/guanosine-3',5'-bis(diphosphate) 3'-pyrophosphohydrolase [Bacteroidales bacterium]|nr:bifunctional (p)ppGpp synthetase/guanosine-3',5'-bis(diphosphate) 3'-pyrophosphohydrolase [Bacteroidales bacterium]